MIPWHEWDAAAQWALVALVLAAGLEAVLRWWFA